MNGERVHVQSIESGEPSLSWQEAGGPIGVKCRKTVAKLVREGHLVRLPGIAQLRITASSLRAYLAGETTRKGASGAQG
jgi:hypothetical protein